MSEKFYTILTAIGKAKIANSGVLGTKVNFVKLKVGDGNGSYYNPTEDQTDLINTVWEGNITHISVDEKNPNWINIEIMIPANVGGFMIREYGAFDNEGNMLAIAKCAESYKPLAEDGSTKELLIKMILAVSNTENITLKIDPTIIFAKKSELEVLENKINNIKVPVTKVNEKIGNVVLTAEDIKCKNGTSVETSLDDLKTDNTRLTNAKDITGAINELFTNANNGKTLIFNVVGSPLLATDTFQQHSDKIQTLKNTFATNLKNKEQPSQGTESLQSLINKVANINVGKRWASGRIEITKYQVEINGLNFKPSTLIISSYPTCGVATRNLSQEYVEYAFTTKADHDYNRWSMDVKWLDDGVTFNLDTSYGQSYPFRLSWLAYE